MRLFEHVCREYDGVARGNELKTGGDSLVPKTTTMDAQIYGSISEI
jgi:hypothetical protein